MRSTTSELTNFKLADAQVGIEFIRNMLDGYQLLKDALIIAETPNIGKPSMIKVQNTSYFGERFHLKNLIYSQVMEDGKWIRKEAARSYPKPTHPHTPIVGVKVHNDTMYRSSL